MQLYFFHLRRGEEVVLDPEGIRVADLGEAREVAIADARALIIEHLKRDGPVPLDDAIEVTDEHGAVLLAVALRQALG
jgi:hypothetical protein